MSAIPEKVKYLQDTKTQIANTIATTGLDTEVPLAQYSTLVDKIPDTGAITRKEISDFTKLAISISGEKA